MPGKWLLMKPIAHSDTVERHDPVMRPVDEKARETNAKTMKKETAVVLVVYVILLLLGVGTGYLIAQKGGVAVGSPAGTPISTEKIVGVQDASTFKDCATGTLEAGGSEGEGTHKLIREGGPSQTAYLFSSIVDLDQYVNLTVKVCGQTMAAKKVSWLMDVGRLEIQE